MEHLTFLGLFRVGGVAMWIIGLCSVLALAVFFERLASLWRFVDRARSLGEVVKRCLRHDAVAEGRAACERSKSPLADVLLVGFERSGQKEEALSAAVERERQRVTLDLRGQLWILGTIGATAPFVGLFGTVVGIMRAFHSMAAAGTGGFTVVAEGISEALVTTAGGILVAVEAVVIYNYFQSRLARTAVELKLIVEEFLEALRERGSEAHGAGQATGG
jgi:biopolymer transport protein ExbB